MMNRHDATRFETAVVRDGLDVDVVLRRRGVAILDHLTPAERKAVDAYAATFEAVAAGGATMPRDTLAGAGGGSAGGPSREGRQSQVLDQAAFLRRMAAAVAARGVLVFGKRKPVEVPALTFWHGFAVDGLSVRDFLSRHGMAIKGENSRAVVDQVRQMAGLVLDAMAAGRDPFA